MASEVINLVRASRRIITGENRLDSCSGLDPKDDTKVPQGPMEGQEARVPQKVAMWRKTRPDSMHV